jgi:hypothetical protein
VAELAVAMGVAPSALTRESPAMLATLLLVLEEQARANREAAR